MEWSKYQSEVFKFVETMPANLHVAALAGSGKTTVIKEVAIRLAKDPQVSIQIVAFNKHIADPLKVKMQNYCNVAVCTMNSFGNSVVRANTKGWMKVDADKTQKILQWEIFDFKNANNDVKGDYYKCKGAICRLVSLLKANNRHQVVGIDDLCLKHGIEIPTLKTCQFMNVLYAVWEKSLSERLRIDFDDQIFYPILFDMPITKSDYVIVDEAQDLNPVQIDLITRMGKHIITVGDKNQAIYGFRGADVQAVDTIISKCNSTQLPLSICYRCSKKVIEAAKELVPEIEASPTAIEGAVKHVNLKDFVFERGQYVLCRCTAPLVSHCMRLIRKGMRATIIGRSIGEDLVNFVQGIEGETIEDFETNLMDLAAKKAEVAKRRGVENVDFNDKVETIMVIAESCNSKSELINKISLLFSEQREGDGVTFSTVHKAKGLEAKDVIIIRPDLMPHPKATDQQQEKNLKYVAITRAMETLTIVTGKE